MIYRQILSKVFGSTQLNAFFFCKMHLMSLAQRTPREANVALSGLLCLCHSDSGLFLCIRRALVSPTCIQLIRTDLYQLLMFILCKYIILVMLSWGNYVFLSSFYLSPFRLCRVRCRCFRGCCGRRFGETQAQCERQSSAGSPSVCRCSASHPQGERFILFLLETLFFFTFRHHRKLVSVLCYWSVVPLPKFIVIRWETWWTWCIF